MYSQLIFNKGDRNTQYGKDCIFNKLWWENWIVTCKRMTMNSDLTQKLSQNGLKFKSKWIKDLNVRPENVKVLEGNRGKSP